MTSRVINDATFRSKQRESHSSEIWQRERLRQEKSKQHKITRCLKSLCNTILNNYGERGTLNLDIEKVVIISPI